MVESGVLLLKYWLEVSPEEQTRRLQDRIEDPRKIWKLSPMDLKSYSRWYDYSRARDEMFAATDLEFAPWYVARSDDKRRARLNIIAHLLSKIPYERTKPEKIKLPERQKRRAYREPEHPLRYVRSGLDGVAARSVVVLEARARPDHGAPDCGSRGCGVHESVLASAATWVGEVAFFFATGLGPPRARRAPPPAAQVLILEPAPTRLPAARERAARLPSETSQFGPHRHRRH